MITTEFGKTLEPGDKICCQGLTVTVGDTIFYNAYFGKEDGHYIEFLDSEGNYHYWKQGCDGGYVIPKS